ncbi:Protein of unknown function [Gryllus bimaculatus]|nr:Protein of unknown function [Gryllus bimaculatus]
MSIEIRFGATGRWIRVAVLVNAEQSLAPASGRFMLERCVGERCGASAMVGRGRGNIIGHRGRWRRRRQRGRRAPRRGSIIQQRGSVRRIINSYFVLRVHLVKKDGSGDSAGKNNSVFSACRCISSLV